MLNFASRRASPASPPRCRQARDGPSPFCRAAAFSRLEGRSRGAGLFLKARVPPAGCSSVSLSQGPTRRLLVCQVCLDGDEREGRKASFPTLAGGGEALSRKCLQGQGRNGIRRAGTEDGSRRDQAA